MEKSPGGNQENRSMGEQETLGFIKKLGLKPLEAQAWEKGQMILYVLTEEARGQHAFKNKGEMPSFAVLYGIEKITYQPRAKKDLAIPFYNLDNPQGGVVRFFAIDAETKETRYLSTRVDEKKGWNAYQAREDTIFQIDKSFRLPESK